MALTQPPNAMPQQAAPPPIYDWPTLLQRFYRSEQQLQLLMIQMQTMQKQIEDIKSQPPLHVEYHFDQLKVNRLEGTLNVGITPQGMPSIESLETPGAPCWKVEPSPQGADDDPVRGMQAEIGAYMDREGARALIALERQYAIPLDEDHRAKVVEDVRRQLNERVRYYVTMKPPPKDGSEEDQGKWRAEIKEKTTRDINGAFAAYLQKLSANEGGTSRP
ncbi:spore germination protein GerPC [Cohnella sp. GCM10027633]|uniref:spore germination protein GerPC n=1 Tax=unclassified Cohnella TaxID=2636738 RepID=UPI003624EDC8